MSRANQLTLLFPLLAAVLLGGFIGSGFKLDDYMYLNQAGENVPAGDFGAALSMYELSSSEEFGLFESVWWAHPDFNFEFMRPATGLLFYLHYALFEHQSAAYFIAPLLLLLSLLLVWRHFYLMLLPPTTAALALLFVCLHHVLPESFYWISNHHVFPATLLAWCSLLFYRRWRVDGSARHCFGHLLCALGSLTFGEVALSTLICIYIYEFVLLGSRGRALIRFLAPLTMLLLAYILLYKYLGYGARQSGMYVNPFGEFSVLAHSLPNRALLALETLLGMGAFSLEGKSRLPGAAAYLAFIGLWLAYLWRHLVAEQRRLLAFSLLAMFGAMGPGLLAFPSDRVLLPALVFSSMSLAQLIGYSVSHLFAGQRIAGQRSRLASMGMGCGIVACFGIHLFYQPAYTLSVSRQKASGLAGIERQVIEMPLPDGHRQQAQTVFLNARNDAFAFYAANIASHLDLPYPADRHYLSVCRRPLLVERVDDNTLRLHSEGKDHLINCSFARMVTTSEYLRSTDEFPGELFTTQVRARVNGFPTTVDFIFDRSLDDESIELIYYKQRALQRAQLGHIGDKLRI